MLKLIRGPRVPLRALVEEHTMVPKLSMSASFAEPEPGNKSGGGRRGKDRGKGGRKGGRNKFGDAVSRASVREVKRAGAPPPIPSGDGALVAVACRGGSVGTRVWLHRVNVGGDDGWVPHRCELATPEGVEAWVFGEWNRSDVGLLVPGVSHQTHPAGNSCVYRAKRTADVTSSKYFVPYEGYLTDDDTAGSDVQSRRCQEAAAVPAARGEGGHVLVAPR